MSSIQSILHKNHYCQNRSLSSIHICKLFPLEKSSTVSTLSGECRGPPIRAHQSLGGQPIFSDRSSLPCPVVTWQWRWSCCNHLALEEALREEMAGNVSVCGRTMGFQGNDKQRSLGTADYNHGLTDLDSVALVQRKTKEACSCEPSSSVSLEGSSSPPAVPGFPCSQHHHSPLPAGSFYHPILQKGKTEVQTQ